MINSDSKVEVNLSYTPYQLYVLEALNIVFESSLFASELKRESLEEVGTELVAHATSFNQCEPALEYIIQKLREKGDNHSHLVSVSGLKQQKSESIEPSGEIINNCGFIMIPSISGFDAILLSKYISKIQGFIKEMDTKDIEGWIIDLRSNGGGNMEPMVLGVGPLFDSETLGYFIFKNGHKHSWAYRNGCYLYNGEEAVSIDNHHMLSRIRPIAILIGNKTSSSGEMLLVSFLGNENVRTFGRSTADYLTGVNVFELSDGRLLALATSQTADRNGKIYDKGIEPDVLCGDDEVMDLAVEWIRKKQI